MSYRRSGEIVIISTAEGVQTQHQLEAASFTWMRKSYLDRGWNDIGIQEIYTALVHDDQRSNLIVADVEAAIEEERFPLLLTEGTDHLEILFEKLVRRVPNVL